MRLALAQLNAVVGDLAGNRALIVDAIREARAAGADLVVFPELAVTGYPPEDLLLRPGFVKAARASLDEITAATEGITALVGCPLFDRDLANACAVLGERGAARRLPQALSSRTTASSTSTATSPPAESSCCSAAATCSSARRSARTSGSPARPRRISRSPARS